MFFPLSFVVMSNEEDITTTIFSSNQCTTLSDLINLHFQRTCVLEEAYDTKIYGCVIVWIQYSIRLNTAVYVPRRSRETEYFSW